MSFHPVINKIFGDITPETRTAKSGQVFSIKQLSERINKRITLREIKKVNKETTLVRFDKKTGDELDPTNTPKYRLDRADKYVPSETLILLFANASGVTTNSFGGELITDILLELTNCIENPTKKSIQPKTEIDEPNDFDNIIDDLLNDDEEIVNHGFGSSKKPIKKSIQPKTEIDEPNDFDNIIDDLLNDDLDNLIDDLLNDDDDDDEELANYGFGSSKKPIKKSIQPKTEIDEPNDFDNIIDDLLNDVEERDEEIVNYGFGSSKKPIKKSIQPKVKTIVEERDEEIVNYGFGSSKKPIKKSIQPKVKTIVEERNVVDNITVRKLETLKTVAPLTSKALEVTANNVLQVGTKKQGRKTDLSVLVENENGTKSYIAFGDIPDLDVVGEVLYHDKNLPEHMGVDYTNPNGGLYYDKFNNTTNVYEPRSDKGLLLEKELEKIEKRLGITHSDTSDTFKKWRLRNEVLVASAFSESKVEDMWKSMSGEERKKTGFRSGYSYIQHMETLNNEKWGDYRYTIQAIKNEYISTTKLISAELRKVDLTQFSAQNLLHIKNDSTVLEIV
jgi:hypothetical protein